YQRFLGWALRHRALMLLLVLMVFGGNFYLFNKYVTKGTIFAWGKDTYISVSIRMPPGAELESTDAIARKFEEKLLGNKNVKHFYANVTDEYGFIVVLFPEEIETTAIPLIIKEQLTALAVQMAGVDIGVYGFGPGFFGGGGAAPQFRLKVLGYNYNEVKRIAEDIGRKLQRHSRVRDVNTSSSGWFGRDDRFEMVLRLNRDKLSAYQLTAAEVLQKLQGYLRESFTWQRIKLSGREVDYRIKMSGYQEFDLANLQTLILDTQNNQKVRLSQIGEISERKVLSRIVREDQQYQRWITFEYRGPYKLGDRLVENLIQNTHLPAGYKLERGTFFFLGEEEKQQIYLVLALAILLVYMVTAALFESLRHPLVIILTVPMALIGVFLIFYLTDTPFDRSAYIGVILLGGIVVNNAIILVDHINFLRRNGAALLEAIINGASHRVRPILMTTATTVMGLLPLVLFPKGEQSIWYSLALATSGGLLSSTILVLTVIPVLYLSLEKLKSR
ncbi:MAG: efflux RND transporter permease subunit, partial [candidate division KSB1 bacterium]|nr:efflux RND transporter permease subunit [candidate division KSB1 bacterium]